MTYDVGNLQGNYSYIDVFKAGNTVGIQNVDGRVLTGVEVLNIVEQCGNIVGMKYDEEALLIIFKFDSNVALRIYGKSALDSFSSLVKTRPELGKKICSQVNVLNNKDTKRHLKETVKRVKRMNKYARRRATAGLAAVCSIAIGISTASYFTKDRSEVDTEIIDITNSTIYELPTVTEEPKIEEPIFVYPEEVDDSIKLDYEDRSFLSKAVLCKESYYDKIVKYSKMYGVDPQIMLGIATQERGTHSNNMDDSGAIGLMQLEVEVWGNPDNTDGVLSAYNYEENKRDTFQLPLQDMGDLDNNIRYSCMIFQNCMTQMNDNVIAAIQDYNYGYRNMQKVFANYSATTNISMDEALADYTNLDWLNCREYGINVGDPEYVENVLGWLGTDNKFKIKTNAGEDKDVAVKAKTYSKVY